jgi:hypothetical protein
VANNKLNWDVVWRIRSAWADEPHPTAEALADLHGVSAQSIYNIVHNRTWRSSVVPTPISQHNDALYVDINAPAPWELVDLQSLPDRPFTPDEIGELRHGRASGDSIAFLAWLFDANPQTVVQLLEA